MAESTQVTGATLPDGGRLLPVLSARQMEALRFIYDYAVEHRDYPTGPEIAERLGISKQGAASMVGTLVKKGYAFKDKNFSERNIRLTEVAIERMQREAGRSAELFPQ